MTKDSFKKKELKIPTRRKTAREHAFSLVYERLVSGERNEFSFSVVKENLGEQGEYFATAVGAVDNNFEFLSTTIADLASGYKLERIYKVDLALMLLASAEILYIDDIPDLVSLNEVLEIAKRYSSENSSKFIHGILSSIMVKKEELLQQ